MGPELLTILPNLSIGVVSIGALVYITLTFLKALAAANERNERAMKEREDALRKVESQVRTELVGALQKSNTVIAENTKMMERMSFRMDKDK